MARAGARVALVDGSHPREKPCGGGVTGRALELVGASRVSGARPIRHVRFERGNSAACVDLPSGYLDIFSRESFDLALAETARNTGAVSIAARASSMSREAGRWRVTADGTTLTAPIIL